MNPPGNILSAAPLQQTPKRPDETDCELGHAEIFGSSRALIDSGGGKVPIPNRQIRLSEAVLICDGGRGVAMKPTRASASDALKHMLLGGFVFWAPDVLVHWLRASRFSNFDVVGLTVLLPATTYLFFQIVWWPARNQYDRLSPALFAVLGIWILGPSMSALSLIFCDRLSRSDAWHFFAIGTLLFPLFTFLMSTYDGSVFAVFLATLVLPIFANTRLRSSAS